MRTRVKIAVALIAIGCGGAGTMASTPKQHMCAGPLLGTWKLQSYTLEYQDTGEKVEPYGAHPSGYLSYGADCRMCVILAGDGRKPPKQLIPTDAEKIALFSDMAAYAGTYIIEGDMVSHHVDISWIEAWTGTTQVRHFKIEGDTLRIRSVPAKDFLDGRVTFATLVWTKVQ